MSADLPSFEALAAMGATRAAAFWLERLQHVDTGEEDAEFRVWLAASEANRDAWGRAIDLWDSFDEAEDETFEEMRRDALAFRPRRLVTPWLRYAMAASVALAISTVVALNSGLFGGHRSDQRLAERPDLHAFGAPDFVTAAGQRADVTLNDGSKLSLGAGSAVDVAYVRDGRLARLVRGRAFFDIAHDAAHPFRVAVGDRVISVLGTRFSVQIAQHATRIELVQGSISVSKGSDPRYPGKEIERLRPGEELIVRVGAEDAIRVKDIGPSREQPPAFLQFNGRTLAAAIEELNRYTDRKLVVRDPHLAALRISGAFPTNNMDAFIQTLTALYPVRVVPAADGRREIVRRR